MTDATLSLPFVVVDFGLMGVALNLFVIVWFGRYLYTSNPNIVLHRYLVAANACCLLANVFALPLHTTSIGNRTLYLLLAWVFFFFSHFANAFFFLIVLHVEVVVSRTPSASRDLGLRNKQDLSVEATYVVIIFTAVASVAHVVMNKRWIVTIYMVFMTILLIRAIAQTSVRVLHLVRRVRGNARTTSGVLTPRSAPNKADCFLKRLCAACVCCLVFAFAIIAYVVLQLMDTTRPIYPPGEQVLPVTLVGFFFDSCHFFCTVLCVWQFWIPKELRERLGSPHSPSSRALKRGKKKKAVAAKPAAMLSAVTEESLQVSSTKQFRGGLKGNALMSKSKKSRDKGALARASPIISGSPVHRTLDHGAPSVTQWEQLLLSQLQGTLGAFSPLDLSSLARVTTKCMVVWMEASRELKGFSVNEERRFSSAEDHHKILEGAMLIPLAPRPGSHAYVRIAGENFLRLSVDVYPTGSTEGHAALILDQGQGVLAVGEVETDATGAVVQWMHRADVSFVRAPQAAITQAGLPLDRLCAGNRTIDSGVEDSELDPLFPPLDAEPASGGGLDVSLERYRLITSRLQAAVSGRGGLEFMPSLVRSTKMEPFLGAAAKEIDSPQEEEGAGSSSPLSPLTPRGKGHTPPQLSMKSRSSSTLSERFCMVTRSVSLRPTRGNVEVNDVILEPEKDKSSAKSLP